MPSCTRQAGSTISAFFAVPLVIAILLCWTIVGCLCSLKGCGVFVYVSALVVTAGLIDNRMGQDEYAFDSSLLGERTSALTGGWSTDEGRGGGWAFVARSMEGEWHLVYVCLGRVSGHSNSTPARQPRHC